MYMCMHACGIPLICAVSPQFLDMNGTVLLSLLIECYQKFHLVARSKFTGVTALGERIHVEKHTPRTPFILVCNKPVLEEQWGRGFQVKWRRGGTPEYWDRKWQTLHELRAEYNFTSYHKWACSSDISLTYQHDNVHVHMYIAM